MQIRKSKKVIASTAACSLTAVAVLATMIALPLTNAKSYTVDFNEGDYSVWDGVTYTFDWYESPSIDESGNTVYTITQASDLAGLAILTNDLSKSEFSYITANIDASHAEYIALMHDFDGEIINVATDINLDNNDWFPIAYPWKTANLSSTYEITTPSGETTNYIALSEVPELETVDSYVGDVNGNPISTRYWEFPESELRFRDLMYTITPTESLLTDPQEVGTHTLLNYIYSSGMPLTSKGEDNIVTTAYRLSINRVSEQNEHNLKTVSARRTNFDETMVSTYGYKDISGYTETNGFQGTLDFGDHKLKDVKPVTKWTEDTALRTNTYDPMGKALIGMLGENGSVKNLKVRGTYNDIASYSAFVAAYNYGTIDNVYVQGFMEQQLITMLYPINRDYSPNHDSSYRMSESAGTVLPVGHCGYVTAVNNGKIHNCITEGEATQVFRSFGFMACVNNGEITSCTNGADVASRPIKTDFYTDEWSWDNGGHQVEVNRETYAAWSTDVYIDDIIDIPDYYDSNTATQEMISLYNFYGIGNGIDIDVNAKYMAVLASTHLTGERHSIGHGVQFSDRIWVIHGMSITNAPPSLNYLDSSSNPEENIVWMPQLYNTEKGESIAANHLYGVYSYTAVGGICTINNGTVKTCKNEGNITALGNTSPRTAWKAVDSMDEAVADTRPSYSYIRPTNQYSFLCTQTDVVNLAAGICAENNGDIDNCYNVKPINKRSLTDSENISYTVNDLDFIPWTQNGFYQNDCIVLGTTSKEIYPGGYRWWITEENKDRYAKYSETHKVYNEETEEYSYVKFEGNFPTFDRNMPYPFVKPCSGKGTDYVHVKTGAINYYNTGNITNCEASGTADVGVTSRSYSPTFNEISISDCKALGTFDLATIAYNTNDTSISNCDVTSNGTASYAFARTAYGDHARIKLNNLIDNSQFGGFEYVTNADINNVYLYNTDTGLGIASLIKDSNIDTCENYQPSKYGLSDLAATDVSNVKVYGSTEFAIGKTARDSNIDNYYTYNTISSSVLGSGSSCSYTNCGFYNMTPKTSQIARASNIGDTKDTTLKNVEVFSNTSDYIFYADSAIISNLIIYCDSDIGADVDYLLKFNDTEAQDMLIQSNVNYTFEDPFVTGNVQDIPGILKEYLDTNEFTNCMIQTPDGMVSYKTNNLFSSDDNTIASDAKMVYDTNARESGALAFYMDHGDSDNRTFNYTVADSDKVYPNSSHANYTVEELSLPKYTRRIASDTELPFYQVRIPLTGHGVGELIGSNNGYSTGAREVLFPKIDVYGHSGDSIMLSTVNEQGYTLNGIDIAYGNTTEALASESSAGAPYKRTTYTIDDKSVQLLAKWDGVFSVSVESDPRNYYTIEPSCLGAAQGELINVSVSCNKDNMAVTKLMYYNIIKDSAGRDYTDYNNPVFIDLTTLSFVMPNNPVLLSATIENSVAEILGFTLGGKQGIINDNTITINLENSLDLTSVAPDRVILNENCTISPDVTEPRNFTQPVTYTVTAASGNAVEYTVIVNTVEDGIISEYSILGKKAVIDDSNNTISITLSDAIDLSIVEPYIVYGGTALVASTEHPENGTTYTVTDSLGVEHIYTLNITLSNESTFTGIYLSISGNPLVLDINKLSKVIYVYYTYGQDVSNVHVDNISWYGSNSSINTGDNINLTKSNTLTIVDDTGVSELYTLSAIEMPSTECKLWQFVLYGQEGVINGNEVHITVPEKYDITNIMPDVVGYTGQSITDISVRKDFSEPVTYTITAYDGSTVDYTIIVTKE